MTTNADGRGASDLCDQLGPLVEAAGMVNLLNHGAASCVYSEGCHGVTQEHLERFVELVRHDPHAEHWRTLALAGEAIARSPACGPEQASAFCAAIDRLADALMGTTQKGEPMTREEWMRRYAARVMEAANWDERPAMMAAKAGAESEEADAREEGRAVVWADPESAADSEMSYWTDDE